jgi:hypothetical protein
MGFFGETEGQEGDQRLWLVTFDDGDAEEYTEEDVVVRDLSLSPLHQLLFCARVSVYCF